MNEIDLNILHLFESRLFSFSWVFLPLFQLLYHRTNRNQSNLLILTANLPHILNDNDLNVKKYSI
jgi:hypothetical protein